MSIDRTDYLIIGYKFPADFTSKSGVKLGQIIYEDDKYLSIFEGWKDEPFTIVADGMTSKYIVFGKTLATSDTYTGFEFTELSVDLDDYRLVQNKAKELFADYDYVFAKPQLLIFSHYH